MFQRLVEYKLFFNQHVGGKRIPEDYKYIQAIPYESYMEFIVFSLPTAQDPRIDFLTLTDQYRALHIPAEEICRKAYRYELKDLKNSISFLAMKGIWSGEVTGETASNIIWSFLYDIEIAPMNENSWVKEHFPVNWKFYIDLLILSNEKMAKEVIDS
jgi:hypothetical protein